MRYGILRLGTTLGLAVLSITCLIVACSGDNPNNATEGNVALAPTATSCATPQESCPCDVEGSVTSCGNKVTGPSPNFIYCYEGTRSCTNGKWGACGSGTVEAKALTDIQLMNVSSSPTACSGGAGNNINACQTGQNAGQQCASNADCPSGERYCTGPAELTQKCKDDGDCTLTCGLFAGHCTSGPAAILGIGCNDSTLCLGGTCTLDTGGGDCKNFTGLCIGGPNDRAPCSAPADCPAEGTCDTTTLFGQCLGGTHNGANCKADSQCTGGVCSNDSTTGVDASNAVDPCDPYCNVYSDTQSDIDAGAGFVEGDGGITLGQKCGDGIVAGTEQCDDGNTVSGDGCSSTCQIETGYACPTPGAPCVLAVCGDGKVQGGEQCDDGNTMSNDGCSSTCQLEAGYYCPTPGSACLPQVCGNGTVEGTEQCDDGNNRPYDGCYNCQKEVVCPVAATGTNATPCTATCGDGIRFPSEGCDDGNLIDGDGCDHNCNVEVGATCVDSTAPLPASLDVPVIYRDFWAYLGTLPTYGHPDFEHDPVTGDVPHTGSSYGTCVHSPAAPSQHNGIMSNTLSSTDHEPVANPSGPYKNECNQTSVNDWYRDNAHAKTILGQYIRLFQTAPGANTYKFDSSLDTVTTAGINCGDGTHSCSSVLTSGISAGFFPIQNEGWGNFYPESYGSTPPWASAKVNFNFTSEVRLPFTYKGGESLVFSGDDDVFVFVGGQLVVDIGGIHGPDPGSVTLGSGTTIVNTATPINLAVGTTYEIDVFQAERNTVGSNYKLTLGGFQQTISKCTPPPPPQTLTRDYEAICPSGTRAYWQVFRWQAAVPNTSSEIDFRAATADTEGALPTSKTDPSTVSIGSATSTNSPAGGPTNWVSLQETVSPFDPIPVDDQLTAANQVSESWLRVYMTFTGAPVLYQWQQLYDCIPDE